MYISFIINHDKEKQLSIFKLLAYYGYHWNSGNNLWPPMPLPAPVDKYAISIDPKRKSVIYTDFKEQFEAWKISHHYDIEVI